MRGRRLGPKALTSPITLIYLFIYLMSLYVPVEYNVSHETGRIGIHKINIIFPLEFVNSGHAVHTRHK